jgi:hypothetical protein
VFAKHSKIFLSDRLHLGGVDRMQRNFDPIRKQIEARQRCELTDVTTKVVSRNSSQFRNSGQQQSAESFLETRFSQTSERSGGAHDNS